MSGVSKKLMGTTAAGGGFTAIEDVFSTYLYTGNGGVKAITNGIDLAGEGGLVWVKSRSTAQDHVLTDTNRGDTSSLSSNTTAASFSSNIYLGDGFAAIGADAKTNASGETYASWTFRKAPRFFDVVTYTGTGSARTVDHNLGTTVGSIIIKRTDTTSNWAVYHRGNTAAPETDFLSLNLTNATADDATYWNDTAPTDSVFTVGTNAAVNASGGTYVAYLYAHDPLGPSEDGSDGLIACGSYTGGGSSAVNVTLGFEPQFVLIKNTSRSSDWMMHDTMRGMSTTECRFIVANKSEVEGNIGTGRVAPTATGFTVNNAGSNDYGQSGDTLIYIAIRRGPMRAPESGTEVYLPSTATGVVTTGFPVDLHIGATQAGLSTNHRFHDRLRGGTKELVSSSAAAETTVTDLLFDGDEGLRFSFGSGQVNHFFRRAPEFFDVVAYTGTGADLTLPHNLTVAPELIIAKVRNTSSSWGVATSNDWSKYLLLNSANAQATASLFGTPDATNFYPTASGGFSGSGNTYIAYLFATLAGVSKVGSYTGNGTTLNIDCGFTTGARFVLIKGSSFTHDWHVFDTARGIVAGNDPFLELNTTNAENASYDAVDPLSSGFTINQTAVANLNADGASYIFYAIA